jgi:hypothetical protein
MSTKPIYSIDAPDQQRLKIARAEIEAVLKKHDLAGVVVLHTPGMAEFFHDIRPSYSCAWIDDAAGIARARSVLADYGGDKQRQAHDRVATANMAACLFDGLWRAAGTFGAVSEAVDKHFQAEHTAGRHVADPGERSRH